MISIEAQQDLLLKISRQLNKPVTAYAIGGTAMMFLGFKEATLDIDLVFETNAARAAFRRAAEELGYEIMESIEVYGDKQNHPEMLTMGDERLDLFVVNVIDFIFSPEMMKRAEQMHQFNSNLFLKIANPHDIILMKCATDRIKDLDDARRIIGRGGIKWEILIGEAKNQIQRGNELAAFELGGFLEKLKNDLKLDIPSSVLDELFEIVKKQAEEKQGK